MQLLALAVHGFPIRSLDSFEDGLANGMPLLILWPRLHVLVHLTDFHRLLLVYHYEPSQPIHSLEPTSLQKALYHHVDWAVTIFLVVCQKFERVDQVVAQTP